MLAARGRHKAECENSSLTLSSAVLEWLRTAWGIFMISLLLGRWSSLKLRQYLPLRLLSSVISGDVKMDGWDPWQLFDVWPSGTQGQGLRVDILLAVSLTLCKITLLLPL